MLAIEHSFDGRVVTVSLNRPDRRNALNQSLVIELTNAILRLNADTKIRVIVITGSGSVFSAGADLQALQNLQDASFEDNLTDSESLATLFKTMIQSPKLLIAKVNGHAIAGGSGLVAACDIAIASTSAKLGFTEVRIGFVPALVSVLLRNRLSEASLRDVLLSGRLFSSAEAQKMGLVNQVVPDELLDSTVIEYAESISRNTSPHAVAETKSLLYSNAGKNFETALKEAVLMNATARSSSDCQAGIRAFLAKEESPWSQAFDKDHLDLA
ncbi:MAG: enoyl-CoA hydratase-related protein [Bacteroidetes bacterium]|nr:enoyl-CoA hydratase-related protein [Bacteroidota bacterium]